MVNAVKVCDFVANSSFVWEKSTLDYTAVISDDRHHRFTPGDAPVFLLDQKPYTGTGRVMARHDAKGADTKTLRAPPTKGGGSTEYTATWYQKVPTR